MNAAEEAAKHPDSPEAVFAQDSDESFGFATFAFICADGRDWYPLHSSEGPANQFLRRVQTRPVRPEDNLPADEETVTQAVSRPGAQARADAITRAWDTWRAAVNAADIEARVPEAEARAERFAVVRRDLEERIEAATAHILAGITVKGCYAFCLDDEGSQIPEALMTGIVRDLLALDG